MNGEGSFQSCRKEKITPCPGDDSIRAMWTMPPPKGKTSNQSDKKPGGKIRCLERKKIKPAKIWPKWTIEQILSTKNLVETHVDFIMEHGVSMQKQCGWFRQRVLGLQATQWKQQQKWWQTYCISMKIELESSLPISITLEFRSHNIRGRTLRGCK